MRENMYLGLLLILIISGLIYGFCLMGRTNKLVFKTLNIHQNALTNHKNTLESIMKIIKKKEKK